MTRTGSSRPADQSFAERRLAIARSYLRLAEAGQEISPEGEPMNPIVSNAILAVVAYCDALTAKFSGRVNQKDHAGAVKLLRDALGNRFPKAQEAVLTRLIGEKDDVYGPKAATASQAEQVVELTRRFAAWAEDEFNR